MKYCPDCGKELGTGVVKCSNPDCGAEFVVPVDERYFVVINFRQAATQARVHVPWDELSGKQWRLADVLSDESYDRSGDEMRDAGVYVELAPWKCHLFQVRATS